MLGENIKKPEKS